MRIRWVVDNAQISLQIGQVNARFGSGWKQCTGIQPIAKVKTRFSPTSKVDVVPTAPKALEFHKVVSRVVQVSDCSGAVVVVVVVCCRGSRC